jgi:hypothetical protein
MAAVTTKPLRGGLETSFQPGTSWKSIEGIRGEASSRAGFPEGFERRHFVEPRPSAACLGLRQQDADAATGCPVQWIEQSLR